MKYFSTFTGIGGFEIGIHNAYRAKVSGEQADSSRNDEAGQGLVATKGKDISTSNRRLMPGITDWTNERPLCVGYSEIDKYAISVYERHYPNVKNYGDITAIKAEELPDFDCIVGGFPCQAFSIAGKRAGFQDTRGTLFFDLARILEAKKPRLFVFENVKGLLSHDNGNTFKTIISTIDELGYDCQWQVLNSKNHGVPQNRERIIIVGHLRGTRRPEVFPFTSSTDQDTILSSDKGVAVDLTRRADNSHRVRADARFGTLDANYYKGLANQERPGVLVGTLRTHKDGNGFREMQSGLAPTIPARAREDGSGQAVIVNQIINPKLNNYKPSELSVAITASSYKEAPVVLPDIRRLTPMECERLQAFPETEVSAIIEVICIDPQKNSVNAVNQSLKSLKLAGNVENDKLQETVQSAILVSPINNQLINKPVQQHVLISCEENLVEISFQGKLILSVSNATNQSSLALHMPIDNFVQTIVGICSIVEKIIHTGKAEYPQSDSNLTTQENGNTSVRLSGSEMMQLASDVKFDSTTLKELTKCITSSHLDSRSLDLYLKTLFSYVTPAISGYIPELTKNDSTLVFELKAKTGWTKYGRDGELISDTQRYKMCGNAVTTSVIQDVFIKILRELKENK